MVHRPNNDSISFYMIIFIYLSSSKHPIDVCICAHACLYEWKNYMIKQKGSFVEAEN